MKRRALLSAAVAGVMVLVLLLAAQKCKPDSLLLLDWAAKGNHPTPPVSVLIELGSKDTEPTDWSGRAGVTGAKVVQREGYRFRQGDQLVEPDGWKASSRRPIAVPRGNPVAARREGIGSVGVILRLENVKDEANLRVDPPSGSTDKPAVVALKDVLAGKPAPLWNGKAVVRLVSTAVPVTEGKTEDDFPAACYGPDGTLWVVWIGYALRDESRRIQQQPLEEQPRDFKRYDNPEFGDQLFVRYYRSGKWSKPLAVTGPKEDLVRCAIAAEKNGNVWVIYSANRNRNHNIYARNLELKTTKEVSHPEPGVGAEQRLSQRDDERSLCPVACTDQNGNVRVTYQAWESDRESHMTIADCVDGKWINLKHLAFGFGKENWHPCTAAGPDGEVIRAYDTYGQGDYDIIRYTFLSLNHSIGNTPTITSSRFEARPSLCYDARGRLWIAYEEGPELWGKDYGAFDAKDGQPLYSSRSVRVVCLDGEKLKKPAAELPTFDVPTPQLPYGDQGPKFERATRQSAPQIGIDGKGRIWLTYRQKFGSRYTTLAGSYWLTFARRLDGDKWSEPIEVHHSCGMLDHRPVLLPHSAGGLLLVHNSDGRYTTPETLRNRVFLSHVDLPGETVEPKLVPYESPAKDPKLVARAKAEAEAVKRIREHRIEAGGKKYRLLRGEFHRHTEISWDGGPDGSLEDMFRYGLDAAGMDWIANADHDNGGGREYSWWLTQKLTDAYHVPGRFTPLFGYERSVGYPHGHRNCLFAKRGVMTLPRLAEMDAKKQVANIHADDTKMFHRYLKEHDGICAVHTSATSMGTDWRDHDPQVEPLVEIYQGDRMSYEHEEAPRAGFDPKSKKLPANVAGWYPDGFVDRALGKGYKLGFQASSDHWSTHISYCVVLAEKHDRTALLAALKQRHCYGATDDIIVDLRCGDHIMGDELNVTGSPLLSLHVIGTDKLAVIDVLRDSKVVHTLKPDERAYRGEWRDRQATAGQHYYYIRVRQANGELAWASPLWITVRP